MFNHQYFVEDWYVTEEAGQDLFLVTSVQNLFSILFQRILLSFSYQTSNVEAKNVSLLLRILGVPGSNTEPHIGYTC
jgi:hypothetical protein